MAAGSGGKMLTTDMGIDALRTMKRQWVNQDRREHPPIWKQYMRKIDSDEFMEEFTEMGGFGDIPLKDEGDDLNFAKPDTGNITRIQPDVRQLAFAATKQDRRFNKIGKIERASKALARAARRTMEKLAAVPFNLGWSSTRLGSDGVALFSTAHVRADGSTAANTPTTQVDLTSETLEAALAQFALMTDNDGTYIDVKPAVLLVHTSNEANALRITGAQNYWLGGLSGSTPPQQNTWIPNAANTGVPNSYIRRYNLEVVASPYLTDTDAWFLLAPKSEHGVLIVENQAFEDRSFVDMYNQDYCYSVEFAWATGHVTDVGVWGSQGA